MAIFMPGIKCNICNEQILSNEGIIAFSAFVLNKLDPMYFFSDSIFHEKCFMMHPMAKKAMSLYNDIKSKLNSNKICDLCGNIIDKPDDYICFGCFSSDSENLLSRYNAAKYHKKCFINSNIASNIEFLITEMTIAEMWDGNIPF